MLIFVLFMQNHMFVGNTESRGESTFLFHCYFYQLDHLYIEHKINNRNKLFY